MKSDQKSFNEWLQSKGVKEIVEDGPNRKIVKNNEYVNDEQYVFNSKPGNAGNVYRFSGPDCEKEREALIAIISPSSKDLIQEYKNQSN